MLKHNVTDRKAWGIFARDQGTDEATRLNHYGAHPFYLVMEQLPNTDQTPSGNMHGVLLLNSNAMDYSFTPIPSLTIRTIGGILDFFVFLGPKPEQVIQQYTWLVGHSMLPPYWSLGFHLSRWEYRNLTRMKEIVKRNRDAGVPLDVQHADIDYMDARKTFTIDPINYAGMKDYFSELNADGVRTIIILDPALFDDQVSYPATIEAVFDTNELQPWNWEETGSNYTLKCPISALDDPPYRTKAVFRYDEILNKSSRLSQKTLCMSAQQGEIDLNTNKPKYLHYDVHNLYGWSQTKPTLDALRAATGKRGLVLPRSTFVGSGQWSGHWLGDNNATWHEMKRSIIGMIEFNWFGIPFNGADICGYFNSPTEEMCTRWMQVGAFYPFSRNHNNRRTRDQDPAEWSQPALRAMISALRIRYILLPYYYTLFYKAHTEGSTVIRPLFHEYPTDKATLDIFLQFLVGPYLMVAPVTDDGARTVQIYSPSSPWYNFYDGTSISVQSQFVSVEAPLEIIPLFLRGGAILPTQGFANNTKLSRMQPFGLIIVVGSDGNAEGDLFYDDGESIDTTASKAYYYATFKWSLKDTQLTMTVVENNYREISNLKLDSLTIYGLNHTPAVIYVGGKRFAPSLRPNTQIFEIISKMHVILHCVYWLLLNLFIGNDVVGNVQNLSRENTLSTTVSNMNEEPSFVTTRVPLRDHVELAIDYFLPTPTGRFPTILEITPYGRGPNKPNRRFEARYWTQHGYAFVIGDSRGTGDSGGDMVFHAREGKDGYDLIEWIASQPWSNGRIGMRGASYSGENQWYTAREQPPHLSCITPSTTPARPMNEVPYDNGAFLLQWALLWINSYVNIVLPPAGTTHPNPKTWLNHRPLRTLDVFAVGRELPLYRTFLDHPTYDDFWRAIDLLANSLVNITVPTLAFTGWFDGTLTGTIGHFDEVRRSSPRTYDHFLIIGPYMHTSAPDGGYDYLTNEPILMMGDISIPKNALLPARNMTHAFFDWCLKDQARPQWKPTKFFVTGTNRWMTRDVFPPPEAQERLLFLTSNGHANGIQGDGRLQWSSADTTVTDRYSYDPTDPIIVDMEKIPYHLPININTMIDRKDVLVYTSDPKIESLTVIGNIVIELQMSSSARDSDLVVELMDVLPDGRSIKLGSRVSSQLRLRYRDGFDQEVFMIPGTIYSIRIQLGAIGHTFLPGHRIRLAVMSSLFPWLSANPNTDGSIATDMQQPIVANQTIYYTACQPSHIRMMVVDNPVFDL
ncbi:unnamed protein product [Rotaria sp. Silwood2]|nr:unnamed protein product [Rotaria sp. Silwood2]